MPSVSEKEFISNPDNWPKWPYLPICKRSGPPIKDDCYPLCRTLYVGPTKEGKWILHTANIFDLPPTFEEFAKTAKEVFDSVDALLADGWEVD